MDALTAINTRRTPQSQQAHPNQVVNNAGGHVFQVGDDARVHRFLTLGVEGGTYYASEQQLTQDNAKVILAAARTRAIWLVDRVLEVSLAGRAPRQNPAIFALAAAAGLGDDPGRKAALDAVPQVCRTASTLFQFAVYVRQFRGTGRGLRRAIGEGWYGLPDVEKVAYQAVKYRQRHGWTHRDLLRLSHPTTTTPARRALFNWACTGGVTHSYRRVGPGIPRADLAEAAARPVGATPADLPAIITAFERAQTTRDPRVWEQLIAEHPLSWEMLPDEALTVPDVWRALIAKGMPQTALLRQLPRLTRLGILTGDTLATVTAQLADPDRLRKGRVHPINVLVALHTYASGKSTRGSTTWQPARQVVDALDAAFYAAFGAINPAGKRTLIALDVSASMAWPQSMAMGITARAAAAAISLVTVATEPASEVAAFTAEWGHSPGLTWLPLSPRQRMDDVLHHTDNLRLLAGRTDCSLPMRAASQARREYDTFLVFTDNETWAGPVHPFQALQEYRHRMGIPARLVVMSMTPTRFSIANPDDPGMLDVCGLDSAGPQLVADFSRGDI